MQGPCLTLTPPTAACMASSTETGGLWGPANIAFQTRGGTCSMARNSLQETIKLSCEFFSLGHLVKFRTKWTTHMSVENIIASGALCSGWLPTKAWVKSYNKVKDTCPLERRRETPSVQCLLACPWSPPPQSLREQGRRLRRPVGNPGSHEHDHPQITHLPDPRPHQSSAVPTFPSPHTP